MVCLPSGTDDGKKIDGVPLEEFKSRRESLAKKIVEYSNAKENSKFCPVQARHHFVL